MSKRTLKEIRNNLNITQEKVANNVGISRATYSHYENGIRTPKIDIAKKIAKYFNIKIDEIIFLNSNDTN